MSKLTRADSLEQRWISEGHAARVEAVDRWLFEEKLSPASVQSRLQSEFGCKVATTTLYALIHRRRNLRSLDRIRTAQEAAEAINQLPGADAMDSATLKAASQLTFDLVSSGEADADSVSKLVNLLLKKQQIQQDERRLALLERKAKEADAAKATTADESLTPEQKQQKLRQIFGMV